MAFYNPRSTSRPHGFEKTLQVLKEECGDNRLVIFARNVSRPDQTIRVVPLQETTPDMADMRTVVIVGSSKTKIVQHGEQEFVYTPRFMRWMCDEPSPAHPWGMNFGPFGDRGAINHDNGNAQVTRGLNLGIGAAPACVLDTNSLILCHASARCRLGAKRSARKQGGRLGQGQGFCLSTRRSKY